jgi:hypothetical protein
MPRAYRPARPSDDIDAVRAGSGPLAGGVLSPEMASFCESGLSIVVGTRRTDGWPVAVHARGCRVDGATLRVLVQRRESAPVLAGLAAGSGMALTFSRPADHRSIQLKAPGATIATSDAVDVAAVERQLAAYRAGLAAVGYLPSFLTSFTALDADDLAAILFRPTEAFVQTPGPGAGSALR